MPHTDRTPYRPLAGTVVLDLTTALAGPYAILLLAGLGATIVKVENPATGGDSARNNSPDYGRDGLNTARTADTDMPVSMMGRGRNKKNITLNLKKGVPAAEVLTPADALRNPDVRRREEVVELGHPQHGSTGVMGPGVPIRFSHADVRLDQPAPHLGEHTGELLADVRGLTSEEIAELRQAGVI